MDTVTLVQPTRWLCWSNVSESLQGRLVIEWGLTRNALAPGLILIRKKDSPLELLQTSRLVFDKDVGVCMILTKMSLREI
jgi:hypothetical protein